MKAPEHFRPYDHAAAQAGAPIGLRNGAKVTIHHVASDKLIGMFSGGNQSLHAGEWGLDGSAGMSGHENRLDLVMLPLGMCEGKPVFVGDKLESSQGKYSKIAEIGMLLDETCGWRWPRPEPEYPKTRMTGDELQMIWDYHEGTAQESASEVANVAIARACKDGDVVPAAMMEKLAEEVAKTYCPIVREHGIGTGHRRMSLAAIIKRVKEGA